jgi:hypothetical protein
MAADRLADAEAGRTDSDAVRSTPASRRVFGVAEAGRTETGTSLSESEAGSEGLVACAWEERARACSAVFLAMTRGREGAKLGGRQAVSAGALLVI